MSETLAQIAYDTELRLGNGSSPQTFTLVAEVIDIDGLGFTLEEIEATHMKSPNRYKEFISALKEGDEITVTCNCIRSNQVTLKNWADAGVIGDWQVIFPGDLENYAFSATPTGFHVQGIQPNSKLEVVLNMKLAGAILEWS